MRTRAQQLYGLCPPRAKLDNLTVNMLGLDKPSAKLKCHATDQLERRCRATSSRPFQHINESSAVLTRRCS